MRGRKGGSSRGGGLGTEGGDKAPGQDLVIDIPGGLLQEADEKRWHLVVFDQCFQPFDLLGKVVAQHLGDDFDERLFREVVHVSVRAGDLVAPVFLLGGVSEDPVAVQGGGGGQRHGSGPLVRWVAVWEAFYLPTP